jgi:hypothetical protein
MSSRTASTFAPPRRACVSEGVAERVEAPGGRDAEALLEGDERSVEALASRCKAVAVHDEEVRGLLSLDCLLEDLAESSGHRNRPFGTRLRHSELRVGKRFAHMDHGMRKVGVHHPETSDLAVSKIREVSEGNRRPHPPAALTQEQLHGVTRWCAGKLPRLLWHTR